MSKAYWDKKLHDYAEEDWAHKPSIFAELAKEYFPQAGRILELASGYGQDGRYFASLGYEVTQTDFSDTGVNFLKEKESENITTLKQDLSQPFEFADQSFDVVYCHLGLHYFTWEQTERIISEIKRVLKANGIVALFTNSTNDPEHGTGEKIEEDFFLIGDVKKRYFSVESMGRLMQGFETLLLDDNGTTYKDTRFGVFNLIRYVGKKSN